MGWGVDPRFLVPNVSHVCSMVHVCRQQLLLDSLFRAGTLAGVTGSGLGRPLPSPSTAPHPWAQATSLVPWAGSYPGPLLFLSRREQKGAAIRE